MKTFETWLQSLTRLSGRELNRGCVGGWVLVEWTFKFCTLITAQVLSQRVRTILHSANTFTTNPCESQFPFIHVLSWWTSGNVGEVVKQSSCFCSVARLFWHYCFVPHICVLPSLSRNTDRYLLPLAISINLQHCQGGITPKDVLLLGTLLTINSVIDSKYQ